MTRQQPLRLGILLPTRGVLLKGQSPPDLSPLFVLAQRAEDAGLDSVWVGDSLLAKPRLEPLSTLAAVAMRTSRIKLGTAVLLAPLRQPAQLAQMAATVDLLSNGRLILGMGVGGAFTDSQRREWLAVGVPPQERGRRMTELLQVCRLLWAEDKVTFHGRHFNLEDATMEPRPIQKTGIPMLLACHHATGSEAQYCRAARHADGVMGISDSAKQYSQVLQRVHHHAKKEGRADSELHTAFYMTINTNRDRDAAHREADSFIRSYYGQNIWTDKWGPFGRAQEVAQRILVYARSGAQEIVLRFASPDQMAQLNDFVQEVLPLVREGSTKLH